MIHAFYYVLLGIVLDNSTFYCYINPFAMPGHNGPEKYYKSSVLQKCYSVEVLSRTRLETLKKKKKPFNIPGRKFSQQIYLFSTIFHIFMCNTFFLNRSQIFIRRVFIIYTNELYIIYLYILLSYICIIYLYIHTNKLHVSIFRNDLFKRTSYE